MEFSMLTSPLFLRRVMLADAASCTAVGTAQLAFAEPLAHLLHLPAGLLVATGAFMLVYAAAAMFVGLRQPVPTGWVRLFALGNIGWTAGCAALLAAGGLQPSGMGVAWVLMQAVAVLVLGELQWMGARHAPVRGWA